MVIGTDAGDSRALDGVNAERATVVHPVVKSDAADLRAAEDRLEEAIGLAEAISLEVVSPEVVRLSRINAASFLGRGQLQALADRVRAEELSVVVFDCQLSPGQQRNLERGLDCKVIDRTALILEIFGARAQTREGRLQVELAHLSYQRSRLVRSWTHLERQRGGAGFMGGPGERQIELDRRQIDDRIIRLKQDLETVRKRRDLQRKARQKVPYPVVALVGYTNAGKSTLFNRLTGADVIAKDQLFATLDPTMRSIDMPSGTKAILSDTVGFISDLPTQLVAAFRATLEEVTGADVIVHVRDITRPDTDVQAASVHSVLRELGLAMLVEAGLFEVWNKIDTLSPAERDAIYARAEASNGICVPLSALTGEGCDDFLHRVDDILGAGRASMDYELDAAEGAAIAWLYQHGEVLGREDDGRRIRIRVAIDPADAERFANRFHHSGAQVH